VSDATHGSRAEPRTAGGHARTGSVRYPKLSWCPSLASARKVSTANDVDFTEDPRVQIFVKSEEEWRGGDSTCWIVRRKGELPVGDDAVFNRVLEREDASLGLSLVADV